MVHFKFTENENGTALYHSHTGELNFELAEVLQNTNSYMDDMIVYLFIDAYSGKWDVDSAFEKLDKLDYETEWFIARLNKKGITFEFDGECY